MFRIRRVFDDSLPVDKQAITQVQNILRDQFPLISDKDIVKIPSQLKSHFKYNYCSTFFIADDMKGKVQGFAMLLYFMDLNFCYLDYISAAKYETGRGIGGALYERIRGEAILAGSVGIFMECLPDDPLLCSDSELLKQNKTRLRFYEKYGARPIIGTRYEAPVKKDDDNPPYLVFDDLGRNAQLDNKSAKVIVRSILERKYPKLCPKEYVDMVVDSIKDDP